MDGLHLRDPEGPCQPGRGRVLRLPALGDHPEADPAANGVLQVPLGSGQHRAVEGDLREGKATPGSTATSPNTATRATSATPATTAATSPAI